MGEFGKDFLDAQMLADTMNQVAIVLWVVTILVAVVAAIWMFRDADDRGKSGIAGALVGFASAFYGLPCTVIVLCTWILLRPEKVLNSTDRLPDQLPSGIQAAPTTEEFLQGLEEKKI